MKTSVFLSYSRRDGDIVRRLAAVLEARNYTVVFDESQLARDDPDMQLTAQDEWWDALKRMIAACDVMVFVVSPESAQSKVCDDEIAYALSLGKRLVPVLRRNVDFNSVPERLRALNVRIDFRDDADASFETSIGTLTAELDIDIGWYRRGTRLTRQANQWDQDGRSGKYLLRLGAVQDAEFWLQGMAARGQPAGALLGQFVDASKAQELRDARLRRRWKGLASGLATILVLSLFAWWNWSSLQRLYNEFALYRLRSPSNEHLLSLGGKAVFKDCAPILQLCPQMAVVEGGRFMMGASPSDDQARSNELPSRMEAASTFAISTHETTIGEWKTCVSMGGCETHPFPNSNGWPGDDRPVIDVSWRDAVSYTTWLSKMTGRTYRLPTEKEWEFAAKGNVQGGSLPSLYSWGDQEPACMEGDVAAAASSACNASATKPVGTFAPNGFGLYDMHGNVWEWTIDCYSDRPPPGMSSKAECRARVIKGGGWRNTARALRSSVREGVAFDKRDSTIGFRIVRELGSSGR